MTAKLELVGGVAWRYQYDAPDGLTARFGYAETEAEALDQLRSAGVNLSEVTR